MCGQAEAAGAHLRQPIQSMQNYIIVIYWELILRKIPKEKKLTTAARMPTTRADTLGLGTAATHLGTLVL